MSRAGWHRLLAALALVAGVALAAATARAVPAHIPTQLDIPARASHLDGWVARTAPRFWGAALLLGFGLGALPALSWRPSRRAGRRIAWLLSLAVTSHAALLAYRVMDRIPHVFDEFNYLFQAKNFAAGQMAAPAHPFLDHFNELFFVVRGDLWYGSSLPGHPLLLALGVLLGGAWLVNPVSAGVTLLVLHRFLERVLGETPALLGTLLLATSPFFSILSSVYLAHGTSLLCAAVFLLAFSRHVEHGGARDAILAGASFGFGFLARPQAIGIWALPLGAWALVRIARDTTPLRGRLLGSILLALVPFLPLLAFDLAYNKKLTGEWTNTARAIVSPSHQIGFGTDIGKPLAGGRFSGHTPAKGLANVTLNARLLQRDLFGWWGGSLWLVPLSLLSLRRRPMVAIAWGALLINSAVYFAYFTPSPLYGPRYYFETIPALMLLTLEGGAVAVGWLAAMKLPRPAATQGLVGGLGFLSLCAVVVFAPAHVDRYRPLPATALRRALADRAPGRALVLVPPAYFAMRAQSWNDPNLVGELIVGADLGDRKNRALMAAMPDRHAYRFHFDRATDSGRLVDYDADRLRVLVVGIDSATWTVMRPMIERGELPTFARLVREGAAGDLETLSPTVSPAIWTTIATGVLPGKHGISAFIGGEDPAHQLQITSDRRRSAAIWEMANQQGLRADVINYWCTWPVEPIDGVIVSDRATVPNLPDRVSPARLLKRVERLLGRNRPTPRPGGLEATQHAGIDEGRLCDLTLELMDREPAPLTIVYFRNLDIVQHNNWRYYEPDGFDVDPAEAAKKRDIIPAAYRRYDGYLARLLASAPTDTTVVVLSDHGMETSAHEAPVRVLHTNRLLEKAGLLSYTAMPMVDRGLSLASGVTAPIDEPVVVYARDAGALPRVRAALAALRVEGAPLLEPLDEEGLRLRFRLGPAAADGEAAIVGPAGEFELGALVNLAESKVSGQHKRPLPGIVILHGPAIRPGATLHEAHVADVAPTLLALLGLPPAAVADGRVLRAALDDGVNATIDARSRVPYQRAPSASPARLPADVEEATKDELRGLGYIQ